MKRTRIVLATVLLVLFAIGIASAVTGEPSVNFSASDVSGPYPFSVTFTGQAINMSQPFSYHWDFGDGTGAEKTSVSTISPITHVYLHPGKYTVRLAVYDIGFPVTTWVSNTKGDYITVTNQPPIASFTYVENPAPGWVPLVTPMSIQFTDTSTGVIDSRLWDFGDGTQSTEQNPIHLYSAVGVATPYTVTLEVTNDGGTDTETKIIQVLPPKPMASFIPFPRTGPEPLAVQFTDTSTGVGISSWEWTFGDGTTSTEQHPLHAYAHKGLYEVMLRVDSPSGFSIHHQVNAVNVTAVTGPVVCPEPTICPTPTQCPSPSIVGDKTGVYRPGVGFYLKTDMGNVWNPSTDIFLPWDNAVQDKPVSGDWNADGLTETGVYRPGVGFYLKMDQSGIWDPLTDKYLAWDNAAGDLPISGNWNTATIQTETGVYRPGVGFYLKMDDSGTWNASTDKTLAWDNAAGDLPVSH